MALIISIALLAIWIFTKDNNALGSKFRLLYIVSLLFLVISSWTTTNSTGQWFIYLICCSLLLSVIAFVSDKFSGNKLAQLAILIFSLICGNQFNQTCMKYKFHKISVPGEDTNGEILVELKNQDLKNIQSFANEIAANLKPAFHPVSTADTELDNYYVLDIKDDANIDDIILKLLKRNDVLWVEKNEVIPFEFPLKVSQTEKPTLPMTNDPSVMMQWHLSFLKMNLYYDLFQKNNITPVKTANLYILDTGIDGRHEDLNSKEKNSSNDSKGHGTHCAGIAAAITNNGLGVASMVPDNGYIELHSIQVIGQNGFGTQQAIINGIIQASDKGADVISLSLGGITNQEREKAYNDAIRYANLKGAIVVVAAGNANMDGKRYSPANAENAITVTSVNKAGEKSGFSNHVQNLKMGLSAPGEQILSTTPSNTYTAFSGTSMATPQVAGLIAVMKAIKPDLSTEETYHILNSTGKETLNTPKTGKLIQPYEAIKTLLQK